MNARLHIFDAGYPPPLRLACIVALVLGWHLPSLRAELTWPQKTVELSTDGKSAAIEARFPFSNDGKTPVDIVQVQTSCGCTTVALDQHHYEPGQKGEIVAHYAIGNQVGLQKKTILVSTAGAPVGTALTLIVHIPELLHMQPAFLTWKHGETNTAKVITIESTNSAALPLRDVSVQSSNSALAAEVEPTRSRDEYEITVRPKATGELIVATLTIHCRLGAEEKTLRAYASVQPALPAAAASTAGSPTPAQP
jgi:hypothetical protein